MPCESLMAVVNECYKNMDYFLLTIIFCDLEFDYLIVNCNFYPPPKEAMLSLLLVCLSVRVYS